MSLELKRKFIIEQHEKGKTAPQIFTAGKQLEINRMLIKRTIDRFKETFSTKDKPRSGRPRTSRTPRLIKSVSEQIRIDPKRSIRKIAKEVEISERSMRRLCKEDLRMYPYKMQKRQHMSAAIIEKRCKRTSKMTLEAIKWENGKLEILDQLLLPMESKYISVFDTEDGWQVINKMQVRGAPAIAIVGCLSLASELTNKTDLDEVNTLCDYITERLDHLVTARPTAVNMKIAARDLNHYTRGLLKTSNISVKELEQKIITWCIKMLHDDVEANKIIGNFGCDVILNNLPVDKKASILTHCNTGSLATGGYGTALGVVRSLAEQNRLAHCYCTETRPYNQGARLTAYELVHDKLPATLICDNMAAALMNNKDCDAVVLGCDRIAANGDTANKIGTYQLAVVAFHHKVPFYVVGPTTTIDFETACGKDIPIEERSHQEMTHMSGKRVAACGIDCWNPAFDVTPASLITAIITEKGVYKPHELYDKLYVQCNANSV